MVLHCVNVAGGVAHCKSTERNDEYHQSEDEPHVDAAECAFLVLRRLGHESERKVQYSVKDGL